MRSIVAFAAAAIAALPALVSANEPQYYNQRAPAAPPACPDFFSTTITTNTSNPSFGPMYNSIHYQLTTQRVNYGRNTYIQMRMYSNLQDHAIRNITFCVAASSWNATTTGLFNVTEDRPVFKNRVKYSPSVRGTQPKIVGPLPFNSQYLSSSSSANNAETYCVTVPYMKPKGWQKVDFLYYTKPCLYSVTFRGWASFPNPYNSSVKCDADRRSNSTFNQSPTRKYQVRSLVSTNKDMSQSCPNYPW